MCLLLGCGNSRVKKLSLEGGGVFSSPNLTTLDIDPSCSPDVVHDLNSIPYPFADNQFDSVHAYEVLEHTGTQGDWKFFFDQFTEIWRILKDNGILYITTPSPLSPWAWGDPGHTRVIPKESMIFLSQSQYDQVGKTAMTDYRSYYKADFEIVHQGEENGTQMMILRAKK